MRIKTITLRMEGLGDFERQVLTHQLDRALRTNGALTGRRDVPYIARPESDHAPIRINRRDGFSRIDARLLAQCIEAALRQRGVK